MSITLTHPGKNRQVTVPDEVAESYIAQGWEAPGPPAPAAKDSSKKPRKTAGKKGAARARAHDGEAAAVPADADGGEKDQG